jgi:acetyl-CoA carboxylase biotin carboxylase subunit
LPGQGVKFGSFSAFLAEDDILTGNYNIHWLEKWLEANMAEG